jgi:hypothetical protein
MACWRSILVDSRLAIPSPFPLLCRRSFGTVSTMTEGIDIERPELRPSQNSNSTSHCISRSPTTLSPAQSDMGDIFLHDNTLHESHKGFTLRSSRFIPLSSASRQRSSPLPTPIHTALKIRPPHAPPEALNKVSCRSPRPAQDFLLSSSFAGIARR